MLLSFQRRNKPKGPRINERIRAKEVQVIDSEGKNLGILTTHKASEIAKQAGLPVSEKKSSTGICFIGERPFRPFLGKYLSPQPGLIKNEQGQTVGQHHGLPYYTVGQRQGLGIGGLSGHPSGPWYVAKKNIKNNELIVVQGKNHPLLFQKPDNDVYSPRPAELIHSVLKLDFCNCQRKRCGLETV